MEEKLTVSLPKLRLGGGVLLIIFIILVGFALRLQQIDAYSFWTDEGLTPYRSGYPIAKILSNRIVIQEGVTHDTHPALFFLIIHFSRQLFGETDFAFRFPSLLFSILTIPLAFQFGKRLYNAQLGIIVAALFAINPLHIWYANEARMYPLLVFLMMAATYVLWRAIQLSSENKFNAKTQRGKEGKEKSASISEIFDKNFHSWWSYAATKRAFLPMPVYVLLYFVLGGLSLYTQYTAVFVIAFQSLFWVWILWRSGFKKLLVATAVCAILIAIPLVPYTVPRFFKGYEANFSYVSPLVMLQDVYRFFALGRTVDYNDPTIQLLLYIMLGLALLGLYTAKPNYRRLFLLAYLLAVVFGLMAGSLVKPMYQGVRHIMAGSPAYLILVAWGLLFLFEQARAANKGRKAIWAAFAALGLTTILISTAVSLNNYNHNEKYGKSDLRGRVQQIETLAGSNDIIVYNDAVLLPLHEHYQTRPDLAFTASPIYLTGANTVPAQLAALAETYNRIWFIPGAPADKRDETGAVQAWLDANLMPVANFIIQSEAGLAETRVYATEELTAVSPAPSLTQWPDWPTLVGYNLQSKQPITLPVIWFNLLWESSPQPELDMGVQFELRDENGRVWATSTAPIVPSNRTWSTTAANQQSYLLPLDPGTPPGRYTLHAQPVQITVDKNVPLHHSIVLDEIEIAANADWPAKPLWTQLASTLSFANGFDLQKLILPDETVRPGHNLPLTLFWQTDAAQTGLHYELTVTGEDGNILRTQSGKPGAKWLNEWPANTLFREDTGLYFPPQTQPGTYSLHVRLLQDDVPVKGRPFLRPWSTTNNKIGQITVEPWPLETDLPTNTTPINARFGDEIELHSYQLQQNEAALDLILYWQATAVPAKNLFAFVHLTDAAGNIVAQIDFVPVNGLRPTAGWREGEVITDPYTLSLANLPPGEYQLAVGLFDAETFARPFVTQHGQEQPNNQITLTTITLSDKP